VNLGHQRAAQRYQPYADARREGQVQGEKYKENYVGDDVHSNPGIPKIQPKPGCDIPNRNIEAPTNAQASTINDPCADPLIEASTAPATTPAPKPNKKGAISVVCNRTGVA
jgi:hypothetical protein